MVTAHVGYRMNERPLSFTINSATSSACPDSPVRPGNDDF
jgi:hypothetical protein